MLVDRPSSHFEASPVTRLVSWTRFGLFAACLIGCVRIADADGPFRRRVGIRPTTAIVQADPIGRNANAPTPMLGTFYGTPAVIVRGDQPTGGGYSPLGMYGPNNMTIYGPTSIFRATSAPVRVYSRGYDGRVVETEGTSFSTPYRPEASPVIYPTPNSYYYRPRRPNLPPEYPSPINWIDQN